MPGLLVIDRDGERHELEAETGQSIMEILRDAGLPIEAVCGGCCSCATCHVFVAPTWMPAAGERGEAEAELLEHAEFLNQAQSRLSCQIEFRDELDGIELTLAPEE